MITLGPKHFAIDIGRHFVRGAVLDVEAECLTATMALPLPLPIAGLTQGHIEIEPKVILATVDAMVDELTREMGATCHGWISGEPGGVILASELGKPRSNYLSWRDERTVQRGRHARSCMERIRDDWPEPILSSLGRDLQPGSTAPLLHWLSEHQQLPDGVLPLSLGDFVISHGARQPGRMHTTQALGLLELSKSDWHYHAFERIGLGDLWWPELTQDEQPVARWRRGQRDIHWHGSFGNQQCALLGSRLSTDELSVHAATGSHLSLLSDRLQAGPFQTRKYFGGGFVNTLTQLPAGRVVHAFVRLLTELHDADSSESRDPWNALAQRMQYVEATDLRANITSYASAAGLHASLENMTLENLSVGHCLMALCRAMVDQLATASQRLSASNSWGSIALSGELAESLPRMVQLVGERFAVPVREFHGDATLQGLLRLAIVHAREMSH